ncbi:MAG: helix-turn-helix domain-containing protein [Ktedonobacteraceae bacterium]
MSTEGLYVEKASGRVWVDGHLKPGRLSRKEIKFTLHLATRLDKICSRAESVKAVYEAQYEPADDQRLDALVGRIRRKIGDTARPPRFLLTLHARGHCLRECKEYKA